MNITKDILLCAVLLAAIALLSYSCKKERPGHDTRYVTIDTTISAGTLFQLNLQQYGDADDVAAIKTQAASSTRSEIVNSGTGFAPVYYYSAPPAKTTLTDAVVIAITEGGNRGCKSKDSTLVTINFKVQ